MSGSQVLAIHGGCGAISRAKLTDAAEAAAHAGLRRALQAGWAVLSRDGAALDAVTAAVAELENDATFNAGHGATLNQAGFHELDASVMDGADGAAGAVAAVRRVRNPVRAARLLARNSDPLLLAGDAADAWAADAGLDIVDNDYFSTRQRRKHLKRMLERRRRGTTDQADEAERHGTVGAVALDAAGHLAAATSTGGFTAKEPGRVGDSCVVGAGTWADDRTCAVSGTGRGELFMRTVAAHSIHSRMLHLGEALEPACDEALAAIERLGGGAGLCAVDRNGTLYLPFTTEGMYRGWITGDEEFTAIHDTGKGSAG